MLVLGSVGSPRKGGNSEIMVKEALRVCQDEGLKTGFVHLADFQIDPCDECMACKSKKICPIEDDFPPLYEKMLNSDGILLGSPVFFSSAPNGEEGIRAIREFAKNVSRLIKTLEQS